MVKRTAFMGYLKTDAHLSRILPEYLLICHDDKTRGIR